MTEQGEGGVNISEAGREVRAYKPGAGEMTATEKASCFLAPHDPRGRPCGGYMGRVHLIPREVMRRVVSGFADARWSPQVTVPACWRHHGALDIERSIRLTRTDLPPGVEEFAQEYNLEWWLERSYGPRAGAL